MPRRSISLFRRVERALETISQGSTPRDTIRETAQFLVDNFSHDLPARAMVERIFQAVASFSTGPPEDDRTVVVVKRRADTTAEGKP